MTRDEIIRYTKTIIDEISPIDGLMDDIVIDDFGSDKPIDDFISSLLDETATETQLLAPTYFLESNTISGTTLTNDSDNIGSVTKPTDFLKVTRVRLKNWQRPVNVTVSEGSLRADIQGNKFLRGGNAKPVVVEEKDYLRFFPCADTDISTDSNIEYAVKKVAEEVNTELQTPLCWLTASKVLGIVNNTNGQKICKEHFAELLQEVKRKEL